jgi:hypothetical protein
MRARAKVFFILFLLSLIYAGYIFYQTITFPGGVGLAGLAIVLVLVFLAIFSVSFLGIALVNLKQQTSDSGLHKNISVLSAFIGLGLFGVYFLPGSWFEANYFGWQGVSLLVGLVFMIVSVIDIVIKNLKKS